MKQSGATLLELMVVLAVAAILLAIGVPGFASLIHSSRLSGVTNELLSSLHLARSEAIKRNARTVMCPSATGTSCSASGGWHQGWMVFHDANNNASVDVGEAVILIRPPLPQGYEIKGDSKVSKYISYAPSGGTKHISGAFQAGTLTVCEQSTNPADARRIIISSTGRPRTATLDLCP